MGGALVEVARVEVARVEVVQGTSGVRVVTIAGCLPRRWGTPAGWNGASCTPDHCVCRGCFAWVATQQTLLSSQASQPSLGVSELSAIPGIVSSPHLRAYGRTDKSPDLYLHGAVRQPLSPVPGDAQETAIQH